MKMYFYVCLALFFSFSKANALLKMSYVEVNSNNLSNVGCYVLSDNAKPFIQMTSIFAANINGSDANKPEIYFNPQVTNLLSDNYHQISDLQKKGIKVLITLLGNHQNAGWACMTNDNDKMNFAKDIVNMVNKYKLDGVDIDDEYSNCTTNDSSIADIAQYIKEDAAFKGKLLTKALFSDYPHFSNLKLAKYLDYGWEMSYFSGNLGQRLIPYLNYGMKKNNLFLGGDSQQYYPSSANITKYVFNNHFGGIMIYNITTNSQSYLTEIARAEYGNHVNVNVLPDCLK
jgi:GH18 family chitinase